ncbi:NAD(P)H-dependent glycerol-3-phosphate dehydrogenase [soil metagenome]
MTQASQNVKPHLAVLGAGAWGTVLAWLLANNGHEVRLWARREALALVLNTTHENPDYVPGLKLPATVRATSDVAEAVQEVEAVVVVVPSKGLREVLAELPPTPAFVSASKGLEVGSLKRFSEVIAEYQPGAVLAALSGPNLAKEIAAGKPAAATLASHDVHFATDAQRWLNGPTFRVYTSRDLVGVETAGAVKNVVALAAGLCDGLNLGDNAKASIITRGLAEIVRLGTHLGGEAKTFYGLAGLGDVVATCSSPQSRNHSAGVRLAKGETLTDLRASSLNAEGVPTVKAVYEYAAEHGLVLPICQEVYRVVFEQKPAEVALRDLMGRDMKPEG